MKIGLDFDGVIADSQEMKSILALKLYNKEITPDKIKKKYLIENNILTEEQYHKIQQKTYGTEEHGLKIKPIHNALETIKKLEQDGHEMKIITSRKGEKLDIAQQWLRNHNLSLQTIGVGKEMPKTTACKENQIELFVDDDLYKLKPLIETVPNLFMFSYNKSLPNDSKIKEVTSWEELYKKIQEAS